MNDEERLASLVLLLRLPYDDDDDNRPSSSSSTFAPTSSLLLRKALERNSCDALRFLSRLVRHYVAVTTSSLSTSIDDTTDDVNKRRHVLSAQIGYAYLRLATRVAFFRYVTNNDSNDDPVSDCDDVDDDVPVAVVRECEYQLLDSFRLALQSRSRRHINIEEVDIEIVWVVQSLYVSTKVDMNPNNNTRRDEEVWTQHLLDALIDRRRGLQIGHGRSELLSSNGNIIESNDPTDEELMIQTIHSILDGNNSRASSNIIIKPNEDKDEDWSLQYDISILSCIQLTLQPHICKQDNTVVMTDDIIRRMPKWTPNTLFGLIRWSQEQNSQVATTPYSTDVYMIVLQYLHKSILELCDNDENSQTKHDGGQEMRMMHQLYAYCCASQPIEESKTNNDIVNDFAIAIRSFIFHGLLTMTNVISTEHEITMTTTTTTTTPIVLTRKSVSSIRGDIYSLILHLWQYFGIDWLLRSESTVNAVVNSSSSDWWFPKGGDKLGGGEQQQQLGSMWTLCMMVRLAAGEFRIGLGRLITTFEEEYVNDRQLGMITCHTSEVNSCAGIIIQAVSLMTDIVDDDENSSFTQNTAATWSPDAILHIRQSLEDALNSSLQYANTLLSDTLHSYDMNPATSLRTTFILEKEYVGQICCHIIGTIAAELDVDHLLATPQADPIHEHQNNDEEACISSSFAITLCGAIMFCHSLGEKFHQSILDESAAHNQRRSMYDHHHEPLTYLLPCIMSIVSHAASSNLHKESKSNTNEALNSVLVAFQKDDCLMFVISRYLLRTSNEWRSLSQGVDELAIQTSDSLISTVKLCIIIIIEFHSIANSSPIVLEGYLQCSLDNWNKNLTQIVDEWSCENLRSNATAVLNLICSMQ
jgi:hypothetical protein